jgi:hypothetical protein
MKRSKTPEFSNEIIVTSIGITVIQALEFLSNEMNLSESDVKKLWAPYLAAFARIVKPADDMVEKFKYSSKNKLVNAAINSEINKPNDLFYQALPYEYPPCCLMR